MKDMKSTKVVIRGLPPNLVEKDFLQVVESKFADLYDWFSFYPGSQKKGNFSRAYLNFKDAETVIEFCQAFQGHVFVNEKGQPFRAAVEFAPFQRIPKLKPKKDPSEGTIETDPEYLEFLEELEKPVDMLPSAEVQLERKEAEKTGSSSSKEPVIITPLMEFVRQKRAAKRTPKKALSARSVGPTVRTMGLKKGPRGEDPRSHSSKGILSSSPRKAEVKEVKGSQLKGGDKPDPGSPLKSGSVVLMRRQPVFDAEQSAAPAQKSSSKGSGPSQTPSPLLASASSSSHQGPKSLLGPGKNQAVNPGISPGSNPRGLKLASGASGARGRGPSRGRRGGGAGRGSGGRGAGGFSEVKFEGAQGSGPVVIRTRDGPPARGGGRGGILGVPARQMASPHQSGGEQNPTSKPIIAEKPPA